MGRRTRNPLRRQGGFTLIELLVVILIIGILAAIAIPSFLNQKAKANDAGAKVLARTAETAAEAYATDHGGSYTGMEINELHEDRADPERIDERETERRRGDGVGVLK